MNDLGIGKAIAQYLPCKMILEKSGRILNCNGISFSPLALDDDITTGVKKADKSVSNS